jgi:hypothetical protein
MTPTNELRVIPSCIKEVSEAQWKRLKPDADTVLIEVDGKRYVIGKQAQALGGDPTFQKNKCELAEILALVAIEPNPGLDRVHISRLGRVFKLVYPSKNAIALRCIDESRRLKYRAVGEVKTATAT